MATADLYQFTLLTGEGEFLIHPGMALESPDKAVAYAESRLEPLGAKAIRWGHTMRLSNGEAVSLVADVILIDKNPEPWKITSEERNFVKFPKIRHPKDAAKAKARAGISGPVPYNATVKLHGTNAAVGKDMKGNIFFQSRNRLITPDEDNHGFARWMSQPDRLAYYKAKLPLGHIVYGEFAGPGIQDKVAISDVPDKFFSSFSIWAQDRFIPVDRITRAELGIYGPMYRATNIPINFSAKEDMTFLEDMTLAVEECCPFAAEHFEVEGIGEGLVWTPSDRGLYANTDLWFKTKGDKHQKKAKATSYKPRADLSAAQAFFEEAFERRAHQGVAYIVEMHGEATRKHTGDFIKWCVMDVLEEEELPEGVDESQVGKVAGGIAAPWYLSEVG